MPDVMPDLPNLNARLQTAIQAARAAAQLQRGGWNDTLTIETKSNRMDLVTSVDKACDAAIREILQAHHPQDDIITEETYREGTPFTLEAAWVVDPLDGTTNYAHRFPHFAVSIAYVEAGTPQVGVVYDVMRDELYTALVGGGAFLNGEPIRVSRTPRLTEALLATGFPYTSHAHVNLATFQRFLQNSQGIRRPGAAALDLAYLGAGRLDGFWEQGLAPWDVLAGALLVTEAGGHISGFDGQPLDFSQRQIQILASNGQPGLTEAMVAICHDAMAVV